MTYQTKSSSRFLPIEPLSRRLNSKISEPQDAFEGPRRRSDRVKTWFLNYKLSAGSSSTEDTAMEETLPSNTNAATQLASLAIVGGFGRGHVFALDSHIARIGRGDDQDVQLNFGDDSISRQCHAYIANYGGKDGFVIRDGLKPNPVLLNGRTLVGERTLQHGDLIQVGETILRFRRR